MKSIKMVREIAVNATVELLSKMVMYSISHKEIAQAESYVQLDMSRCLGYTGESIEIGSSRVSEIITEVAKKLMDNVLPKTAAAMVLDEYEELTLLVIIKVALILL